MSSENLNNFNYYLGPNVAWRYNSRQQQQREEDSNSELLKKLEDEQNHKMMELQNFHQKVNDSRIQRLQKKFHQQICRKTLQFSSMQQVKINDYEKESVDKILQDPKQKYNILNRVKPKVTNHCKAQNKWNQLHSLSQKHLNLVVTEKVLDKEEQAIEQIYNKFHLEEKYNEYNKNLNKSHHNHVRQQLLKKHMKNFLDQKSIGLVTKTSSKLFDQTFGQNPEQMMQLNFNSTISSTSQLNPKMTTSYFPQKFNVTSRATLSNYSQAESAIKLSQQSRQDDNIKNLLSKNHSDLNGLFVNIVDHKIAINDDNPAVKMYRNRFLLNKKLEEQTLEYNSKSLYNSEPYSRSVKSNNLNPHKIKDSPYLQQQFNYRKADANTLVQSQINYP